MLKIYRLSVYFLITFIRQSTSENAITGNIQRAEPGEYPFVVSISYNNPNKKVTPRENHICGGTLITHSHVLTAAHCFHEFKRNADEIVVLTNDGDLLHSVRHEIKDWITYSEWSNEDMINKELYDIAIVELREHVSSHIKLAEVSCSSTTRVYGEIVKIIGWSTERDNDVSQYLSVGETVILDSKDCLRNVQGDMKSQIEIAGAPLFMCSMANPAVYTENGDSGSPVLKQSNKLIAIHKGSCTFTLNNGVMAYRECTHIPVKYFMKFLKNATGYDERLCCVQ